MEPIEQHLDYWREKLLRRRAELLEVEAMGQQGADTVELDQARVGRLSRMDALQAQAMQQEGNRRRLAELKRIGAALTRLEEGEYGYCLDCGEPMDPRRLALDPAATLCVGCAEARE